MSQDGPLIDLVSRGKQDLNLLSNKLKDSLFIDEHDKHTNFSRGSISVDFKGSGNWGSTIKFTIPKDGDLLSSLYLNVQVPEISVDDIIGISEEDKKNYKIKWTDYIGNALIDKATLRIGGQIIDEQFGVFMQLHTDLYDDDWNKLMMLGHDEYLNIPQNNLVSEELYIPLKFWFSDDHSKSLPLIALNYHDIELEIKFTDYHKCYSVLKVLENGELVHTNKKLRLKQMNKITLEANMVYLSSEERKKVATSEHKILIRQVQRRKMDISTHDTIDLDFNHPIKELFFYIQPRKNIENGEIFNFSSKLKYLSNEYENIKYYDKELYDTLPKQHLLDYARMMFNGKERLSWKNYKYFYYLQNYEHYRNKGTHFIYLYSFAVDPLSINPTGSCNFSRIDNSQIQFKVRKVPETPLTIKDKNNIEKQILVNGTIKNENPGVFTVFATNYNYLIIKSGMAGLEFNN